MLNKKSFKESERKDLKRVTVIGILDFLLLKHTTFAQQAADEERKKCIQIAEKRMQRKAENEKPAADSHTAFRLSL